MKTIKKINKYTEDHLDRCVAWLDILRHKSARARSTKSYK